MAFIKQGEYMLNPAFQSRGLISFNNLGIPNRST